MKSLFLVVLTCLSCGQTGVSSKVPMTVLNSEVDPAPNFHQVAPMIFRSGHLEVASVPLLQSKAIKTILSLEDYLDHRDQVNIDRAWAQANAFDFLNFPFTWVVTGPSIPEIDQALALIVDPLRQPILVHCHGGSDRTGIVIAAYRIKYQHWSYDAAVREMRGFGHNRNYWGWDTILHHYEETVSN